MHLKTNEFIDINLNLSYSPNSSRFQMFFKIDVLKNLTSFTGKHLRWSSFNKVAKLYYKETPTQMFSCEICEVFKNIFFYRTSLDDCFFQSLHHFT